MEFLFTKLGFHLFFANSSIFITSQDIKKSVITTFIHNLYIFPPVGSEIMNEIKGKLDSIFDIIDIGFLVFILDFKVPHN